MRTEQADARPHIDAALAWPPDEFTHHQISCCVAEYLANGQEKEAEELQRAFVSSSGPLVRRPFGQPLSVWLAARLAALFGEQGRAWAHPRGKTLIDEVRSIFREAQDSFGLPFQDHKVVEIEGDGSGQLRFEGPGWCESVGPLARTGWETGEDGPRWSVEDNMAANATEVALVLADCPGFRVPATMVEVDELVGTGWWPQSVRHHAYLRISPAAALSDGTWGASDALPSLTVPDGVLMAVMASMDDEERFALGDGLIDRAEECLAVGRLTASDPDVLRRVQRRVAELFLHESACSLLARISNLLGEGLDLALERTRSEDFQTRLWGAITVRERLGVDRARELLGHLADDPQYDEDFEHHPVRIAAGFEVAQ